MSSQSYRDSCCQRTTFRPDFENIKRSVYVSIKTRTAFGTLPLSYSKRIHTFRAAYRNYSASGTRLGSPNFGNDFALSACRNRLVREEGTQHSPTSIINRLGQSSFSELGRTDISDVNLRVVPHYSSRRNVEEMLSLVGDLRRQITRSALLFSTSVQSQYALRIMIESWGFNFLSRRKGSQSFQAKVNSNCGANALFSFGQLNQNIDVPPSARVSRKIPHATSTLFWDRPRNPQFVISSQKRKCITIKFGGAIKVGERNPVKISFVRTKPWCLGENFISRLYKYSANCVNGIRVDSKFFGGPTAQCSQIKFRGASSRTSCPPIVGGLLVNLAAIVPNKIDRSGLRTQSPASGCTCIFESVAVCEIHGAGRNSSFVRVRSRTRQALMRLAGSCFIPHDGGCSYTLNGGFL